MAVNEYVNRVETVNDEVLMDISEDTVTESDVLKGKTFHLANGAPAVGTRNECDCGDFDILEGNLPISFKGNGNPLYNYEIKGNNINRVDESQSTLPVSIDTYGGNAVDWEIYGNNNPVVENKTGDLPIEVSATAGNAVDWTIYGNNDVGENLVNPADDINSANISNNGSIVVNADYKMSLFKIEQGVTYTICPENATSVGYIYGIFVNKPTIGSQAYDQTRSIGMKTFVAPITGWCAFRGELNSTESMAVKGSTAPDHYIPYQQGVGENTEITGELPIDFRSNGDDLLGYRIYGTAEGAGVKTKNLFNKNATDTANGYVDGKHLRSNGETNSNSLWAITEYIPITGGYNYTFNYGSSSSSPAVCFYNSSKQFIQGIPYGGQNPKTVNILSNVSYIRFSFMKSYVDDIMLVRANSLPTTYPPYGYQIPLKITSGTESKATDVYIGNSKLGEAEYVDYGEQKIYRRILFMTHDNKHFMTKDNKDFCLRRRGYSG